MYPIQVAQFSPGTAPDVLNLAPAAAATFKKGRVLTRVGNTVQAHALGATVTDVYGVAQCGAADGVSDDLSGLVNVAKAGRVVKFLGQLYDSVGLAIVEVDPAVHIGEQYGLIVVDDETYLDTQDQVNVLVEVVDVKTELNIAIFKFLESTLQEP